MKDTLDKAPMPLRVRYTYEKKQDLSLNYAHGVWGGINQQGEIEMNFYLESDAMPKFSERIIEPDGSFGAEEYEEDAAVKTVNRSIHTRVLFNYHTAKAILEWLEERVDALEMEDETFFNEHNDLKQ